MRVLKIYQPLTSNWSDHPGKKALVNSSRSPAWEANWTEVYNGSATRWVASGLTYGHKYVFTVAATNRIGSGDQSRNSSAMVFTPAWMAGLCSSCGSAFVNENIFCVRFVQRQKFVSLPVQAGRKTDDLMIVLFSSFGVIAFFIVALLLLLAGELGCSQKQTDTRTLVFGFGNQNVLRLI